MHYTRKGKIKTDTIKNEKLKLRMVVWGLIVCAIGILSNTMQFDPDILWHYKIGEQIIQTRTLSIIDTFSWQSGLIWSQHEWIYDIILYLIINYTGIVGFKVLYTLNYAMIVILGYKMNCKGYNLLQIFQYITIITTALLILPINRFNRPAELSIWLLVIVVWNNVYKTDKLNNIVYFLFGILCMNIHGGSIIVILPCWLILIITDIIFDKIEHKKFKRTKEILHIILFILGTLINPMTYKMIPALWVVKDMESTQLITEWEPLKVGYFSGFMFILIIISLGYSLKTFKIKRNVSKIAALLCALLILTLTSQKACINFIIVYILFGYEFTNIFLTDLWEKIFTSGMTNHEYEESRTYFNYKITKLKKRVYILSPALICFIIVSTFFTYTDKNRLDDYVYSGNIVKEDSEIIEYLRENKGKKIINGYTYGNYLIYNDIPCYIDTRQTPYESWLKINKNDSLHDYIILKESKNTQKIGEILNKIQADYIVTSSSELDLSWYLENDTNNWEILIEEQSNNNITRLWRKI